LDHRVAVILMAAQLVRSSVNEVEHFEIRAVGQGGQEYFNRWMVGGKVRGLEFQGQPTEVPKERRSPADQNGTEAKGGEVWYWITGWPLQFRG
jgi:hypothetical protein